ncbi:MAG: acyl carrier protein [Candidatus Methylumidiphilus sp.]
MQLDDIKDTLKAIFEERLNMDLSTIKASDDDSLFGDGWGIDSIDVIDIVLGVEQKFGVKLQQDEEVQAHFQSLNSLAAYVQTLIAAKA